MEAQNHPTSTSSSGRLQIGIVVGEASGDILGAALMRALRQHYPDCEFSGIGGPRMLEQGFHSFFPMDRLSVMGLIDPLKRLPELLKIRKFLKTHFTEQPPAVFIGVDSPDFTLNIERHLRAAGTPTVHYVSPSVWAWRQGRVKGIARSVDLMLTLLPFEAAFYEKHQVPVAFVGHHLADEIPLKIDSASARATLGIKHKGPLVALLPGSRNGEVEQLGPLFLKAARLCRDQRPNVQFVIPAASPERYRQIHHQLSEFVDLPVHLVQGQSQQAMAAADVALISSGTTALEAMLLKTPMVVAYKMARLSYAILSRMLKTEYVSLPNLLANRRLVPELIQDDATPESLSAAVLDYIDHPAQTGALVETFTEMHRDLARNASEKAAAAIVELLEARSR
ncbi:lipid-A-disaccharide synthase [Marinimicrobium sp. C6131]|uniref:lipid-A-disaccharide synthase n=1 Tax=Marinimicrobium sp. C6131 TaxID=3022676 RepID=UPI00223D420B|nr:lipid-A-disaccharide synthase [Marinimicrobium sp. C6131]UZJ45839.1 lipid-A-disaccharide synthase [Marinimicrobium sp. C6131]